MSAIRARGPNAPGFSLVELLVVIAILSILAAILFPAYGQVRASANKKAAVANAKQIVQAELLYQGSYDDNFVLYFSGYVANDPLRQYYYPPLMYWPQAISPFIQPVHLPTGQPQALIQDLSRVFIDPVKGFSEQDPDEWPFGNISSWGISDDIVQWQAPVGITPTKTPLSPDAVVQPSECLVFAETWDVYSPGHNLAGSAFAASYFDLAPGGVNGAREFLDSPYAASYRKTSAAQEPDPQGRNVAVFCDGHVVSVATGRLTRSGEMWSANHNAAWP